MILRRPFAFFIKMFKPIHLVLSMLIAYLIFRTNKILNFFSTYLNSSVDVVGENLSSQYINSFIYIIPIVVIVLSLIMLGIMFKKQKPFKFYIVSSLSALVILVMFVYTSNFLITMQKVIVNIKAIKLVHDFILLSIIIEILLFLVFIIRGTGINFKKFDFDSDISKIKIEEEDNGEFELDINVDINEYKRRRKKRFRFLKYKYLENKFLINVVSIIIIFTITLIAVFIINNQKRYNQEGVLYSASNFNMSINNTYILNTDYAGNKITDENLIIVNASINSNYDSVSLFLKDFSLIIGDVIFKPTTKYSKELSDIGNIYDGSILLSEFKNYIFVYKIPDKYTKTDMFLRYNDKGNFFDIKLNPDFLNSKEIEKSVNMGETMSFEDSIGDISFKINSFEIKDNFKLNYNYCISKDYCINSYEYLYPSLDTNFDKIIMKLDVEFNDNSELGMDSFYEFLSRFGSIYYNYGLGWFSQNDEFEEIISKKIKTKDSYIGISSEIINLTGIKFVFDVRGSKYEYILK